MSDLERDAYLPLVDLALQEDIGDGDVTSLSVLPNELVWQAKVVAREDMVIAGRTVAEEVFRSVDPELLLQAEADDAEQVRAGACVLSVEGRARSILSAERVALNFLQRLSGIATLTRTYVDAVNELPCQILDTRKTTPGWRRLEKFAVQCGGGGNHRMGLFDRVMIKDNHLAVLADQPDPIAVAIQRARTEYPGLLIEVEADTLDQVERAAAAGADIILLDNMGVDDLRSAVRLIAGRSKTEASGGVTLETVRSIAETGVDTISVGALTHSAPSVDLALDVDLSR